MPSKNVEKFDRFKNIFWVITILNNTKIRKCYLSHYHVVKSKTFFVNLGPKFFFCGVPVLNNQGFREFNWKLKNIAPFFDFPLEKIFTREQKSFKSLFWQNQPFGNNFSKTPHEKIEGKKGFLPFFKKCYLSHFRITQKIIKNFSSCLEISENFLLFHSKNFYTRPVEAFRIFCKTLEQRWMFYKVLKSSTFFDTKNKKNSPVVFKANSKWWFLFWIKHMQCN